MWFINFKYQINECLDCFNKWFVTPQTVKKKISFVWKQREKKKKKLCWHDNFPSLVGIIRKKMRK